MTYVLLLADDDDDDDEEEEEFEPEEDEEEESEREDTDIEDDEVADLERDAATNMPPKKKSVSPKPSRSAKKKPIEEVTDSMTKLSVASPFSLVKTPPSVCFDFRFPTSKYTIMEETSIKIYVELVGCQLPDDYLKHAKVLPNGRKFSVLIGAPRMIFEEGFMRARMGAEWNPNSAIAVAFNSQVVQPVRQMFPGNSDSVEGNPMLIDLDEQCVEGNVQLLNGDWRVRRTPRVDGQRQFLRGWTFAIEAVKRNLRKVGRAERVVFGYGDSDGDSEEEDENEGNMGI